jgi:D-alanyl-D-alanine carboxypeptidase/D-alanyl-D-alanine-endopeptidase (penicillin-binding protein 4)
MALLARVRWLFALLLVGFVISAPRSAQAASLHDAVSELAAWAEREGGRAGIAVIDTESGALIASHDATLVLNPASNQKIVTAAAALARLGPDFRFRTGLYGRFEGGHVPRLVLRSDGDPSLELEDLWRLSRTLAGMGLKRVDAVYVDQSRFDAQFVPPGFEQQPNEWAAFRAPVSAVALERNTITLNVVASRAGDRATAWFDSGGFIVADGRIETRRPGSGQDVRLALRPEGGRLSVRLSGHVSEGLPRLRLVRRVDDPRLYAGYVLADLLRSLGVEVADRVGAGGEDERRSLVFAESLPLAILLHQLGKHSDNFYAEMIFKALDREGPANSADSSRLVQGFLREIGVLERGTRVVNGSGLFDTNRVSAGSLARLLRYVWRDPALRADFVAQLAIGGVDGTLRGRFRRHRQRRNVRAKTGTLRDVDALSGYVLSPPEREPLAFSFIVQGVTKHAEARRKMDAIVDTLSDVLWASPAPRK